MNTYDAPKGTRVKIKVARIVGAPLLRDRGSATVNYAITGEDGGEHRWDSSHVYYGRKESIPPGPGDLYLSATVDGTFGEWDAAVRERSVLGYRLTRGRFSRVTEQTLPPVTVTYKPW